MANTKRFATERSLADRTQPRQASARRHPLPRDGRERNFLRQSNMDDKQHSNNNVLDEHVEVDCFGSSLEVGAASFRSWYTLGSTVAGGAFKRSCKAVGAHEVTKYHCKVTARKTDSVGPRPTVEYGLMSLLLGDAVVSLLPRNRRHQLNSTHPLIFHFPLQRECPKDRAQGDQKRTKPIGLWSTCKEFASFIDAFAMVIRSKDTVLWRM